MLKKMLNIIKYEWLRRWKFFLAGLAVFTLANIDLVSRIIIKGNPSVLSGLLIAVLFTMVGVLVFDHLGRLYNPLFKEEGTFVFSTPLSGYSLLGGKVLAVALEYIGVAVFVGIVIFIDYLILGGNLAVFWQTGDITLNLLLTRGLQVNLLLLLGYLSFLLTAYLSMALAKSFLSSVKHGGLLSFIIFIVITHVFSLLGEACKYGGLRIEGADFTGYWLIAVAIAAVTAAALFAATGYLLDRKVNI